MKEVGYKGGMVLDPGDLPFHLCSIQIFIVFALKFFVKKEETMQKLLGFMAPTLLIGGVLALVFATVGVKFERPQVYQYFIFHSFIIFFSSYIVKEKLVNWSWKVYAKNLAYLGVYAYVATILNSIIGMGHEKVNFLYVVRPPEEGLPFLNLDNGWYAYFATLVALAITLLAIYHAVIILINKKLLKTHETKTKRLTKPCINKTKIGDFLSPVF